VVVQSVVRNVEAPNVALLIVAILSAKAPNAVVQTAVVQIAVPNAAVLNVALLSGVLNVALLCVALLSGVRNAATRAVAPSVVFQCAAIRVALIAARVSGPFAVLNVGVPHEYSPVASP